MMLLDVRDEVQELAGRPSDRVAPEMWEPLAERLGLADAEAAQRHVRSLGRRIGHLSRLAWRRTDAVMARSTGEKGRRTPALERIAPGIALSRGEVVLDAGTKPGEDPTLLLRAAAEAASRDAVLAPTTAARLVREGAELPTPWPAAARDALVRLLASGPGLLPVGDARRRSGASRRSCPSGSRIRLLPHASTISTGSPSTGTWSRPARRPARSIRGVRRPDLLLVAALLHDIGKGSLHDHSVAGEPWPARWCPGWGSPTSTPRSVASLVRWHLLLATLATTRDPDDPATTAELLTHVPDGATLELLRALTESDARATASAAWTSWRASLVDRLVSRAGTALGAEISHVVALQSLPVPDVVRRDAGAVSVEVTPHEVGATVTVIAADRVGLLADVAGGLAALRVPVKAARRGPRSTTRASGGSAPGRCPTPTSTPRSYGSGSGAWSRATSPSRPPATGRRRASADRGGAPGRVTGLAGAGDPPRPTGRGSSTVSSSHSSTSDSPSPRPTSPPWGPRRSTCSRPGARRGASHGGACGSGRPRRTAGAGGLTRPVGGAAGSRWIRSLPSRRLGLRPRGLARAHRHTTPENDPED